MSNSLNQYMALVNEHRAILDAGSSAPLNAQRDAALQHLSQQPLPEKGEEGFEITSVNDLLAPDYGVNIARVNLPVDVAATFKCDVPNMSSLMGVVANDKFVASQTLLKNLPKGVVVTSLSEALAADAAAAARYTEACARIKDSHVSLNTLLLQDGVYIGLQRGVELEKPLQIVNILASSTPLLAPRRIFIDMAEGARMRLLLCDHSQGATQYFASQVIVANIAERASLDIYDIEESSSATSRYSQCFVTQHEGSQLLTNTITLVNGVTRNEYHVDIVGNHCSTGLYGMAIGGDEQHIDNSTFITHNGTHCTSNQLYRYALDDNSRGAFQGLIEVKPGAQYTEAYQSNNNILVSTGARMHTKPQLIIDNDDVKCSHGATTGQLDAQALFYMQSRGIPLQEARTMLMQAFMVDVINHVDVEAIRDRLRHLVDKRFDGTLGNCATCRSC